MSTDKLRITLIAAGGTISQTRDSQTGNSVPTLTAGDLFARTSLASTVEVRLIDLLSQPGMSPGPDELLRFVRCLQEEATQASDGIVVTHGTDTMEEVAYLIDEAVSSSVSIVFTGAMRPSWTLGYDGIRNLENALRIARTVSTEYGTLVTMNDQIFEAWSVYKADTGALDAFRARRGAPYGHVFGDVVALPWRPLSRRRFLRLSETLPPSVPILTLGAGDDAMLLARASELPIQGIVVASMAAGYVPPNAYRQIVSLAESGRPVVVCSSATSGRTAEEYYYPHAYDDLRAAGVRIEDWLSPRKARIRLMLSIGLQEPYVPFGQEFVPPCR